MKIRQATVSGKFYPSNPEEIKEQLNEILQKENSSINYDLAAKGLIGGVAPHAGYMFSAFHAMHLFKIIQESQITYDTFILIHPNHTGMGSAISLDENEAWETPLGHVKIDMDFYDELFFPLSSAAHIREHSGEVMLPFLQYLLDYDFQIVPVCMAQQTTANAKNIAKSIYQINNNLNKNILMIASSDFSHYVSPGYGKQMDDLVLEQIKKMNSNEIEKVVKENNISVCGYGPIMTLIEYAKLVSDTPKMEILRRGHSGEAMPGSSEVVDYVSMLFYTD